MSEGWGPWIEHDGKRCPCVGMYVQVERRDGSVLEVVAGSQCKAVGVNPDSPLSAWVWPHGIPGSQGVISYRIRKPRALQQLRELVENLPERVDA